mgnify:CR=1 FL=1
MTEEFSTPSAFVDMGLNVIALILGYVPRRSTDVLARYRGTCTDFGNAMNLYAAQMSTDFKPEVGVLLPSMNFRVSSPNQPIFSNL